MKKTLLTLLIIICIMERGSSDDVKKYKSFHDFKAITIDGDTLDFAKLEGKKVLVVNTASKCGFTPQYKELEDLYQLYKDRNFVIIAFPANNFLKQEPGTNDEIKEFCEMNYKITFPIMSKISVKGSDIDPIYKWLTNKNENGVMNAPVKWNFQKFMIDENGKLVGVLPPKVNPKSIEIINWIEK